MRVEGLTLTARVCLTGATGRKSFSLNVRFWPIRAGCEQPLDIQIAAFRGHEIQSTLKSI